MTGVQTCALPILDAQYSGGTQRESFEFYSMDDIVTSQCIEYDQKVNVLEYTVYTFSEHTTGNFFSVTNYLENDFRPLFKDYELFMIWNLVDNKEYYHLPFLLALQRTVYLWLMGIVHFFEFKGNVPLEVIWCRNKPDRAYYDIYRAEVQLSFDFSEVGHCDGIHRNIIKLKLGLPSNFKRDYIHKSDYSSLKEFFDAFWDARAKRIHRKIYEVLFPLHCFEESVINFGK